MLNKLKVLIIEDDQDQASFYVDAIINFDLNLDISCVDSAEKALALSLEHHYDIYIIDWVLPGMDGLELCRKIREIPDYRYPFMIMVTVKKEENLVTILDAGFDDYIAKPVGITDLKIHIEVAKSGIEIRNKFLQQKEYMSTTLNSLNIGAVFLDKNYNLLYANTTATKLLQTDLEPDKDFINQIALSDDDKEKLRLWIKDNNTRNHVIHLEESNVWLDVENIDDDSEEHSEILYLKDISEVTNLRLSLTSESASPLIGVSQSMKHLRDNVSVFANGHWNVIIEGETGTGKELVAKELHRLSPRKERVFIPVNCAGLTESIAASVLFGHKKGAFTGAFSDHIGYFEAASGGTLFLDEIADLPMSIQVMLLRVLEQKEITRVGESNIRKIDTRVIVASNKMLLTQVDRGNFRADLYYRLNDAKIYIPPLRERKEDLPLLINRFLLIHREKYGGKKSVLAPETMRILVAYSWPGNVRQLRSVIQYASIQAHSGTIEPEHLPAEVFKMPTIEKVENKEVENIKNAINISNGNYTMAASVLGMSRATLYRKMKKLNIK